MENQSSGECDPMGTAAGGAAGFRPEEGRVIDEVNRRIAGAESLEAGLALLFELLRPLCPCDRMSVAFLDDDRERLVVYRVVAAYAPLHLTGGYAADVGVASLRKILESGEPRVIGDFEAYARGRPPTDPSALLLREGIRSSVTCPLKTEGRIVGLLFIDSRQRDAFGEGHVRMLQAVVERLSQAVEKAYLIDRLRAANQAYGEMLAFVSHELKSPLSTIIMEGELLTEGYGGALSEGQAKRVRKIVQRGRYMADLVREYLDLANLEGGDVRMRVTAGVDLLADVIDPALDLADPVVREQGMTVEKDVPDACRKVDADPGLLRIAFLNLIGNGAKYGRKEGRIRISAREAGDSVAVTVRNDGVGFRPEDRDRLFLKFSRIPSPEFRQIRGTGVGLYTTWRLVKMHGGSVRAASEHGRWAEFTVEIPRVQPQPA